MKKIASLIFIAFSILAILSSCVNFSMPVPFTATLPPTETITPPPTITATHTPTLTATPWPSKVDTKMGGTLSISGVVKDPSGKTVSNAYVILTVYGAKGGWDIGQLGQSEVYTDDTGNYSFTNVILLESGHYEIWFNGRHEYGKVYENSGYYIPANEVKSNNYSLNVTVHPVTGSAFSGVIQYEDADGSIKDFYAPPFTKDEPGHSVSLARGYPGSKEYGIGSEYRTISGNTIKWQGLAGGTYFLEFSYRRLDGILMGCTSPTFEIPTGETKYLEYTIRECLPSDDPLLP